MRRRISLLVSIGLLAAIVAWGGGLAFRSQGAIVGVEPGRFANGYLGGGGPVEDASGAGPAVSKFAPGGEGGPARRPEPTAGTGAALGSDIYAEGALPERMAGDSDGVRSTGTYLPPYQSALSAGQVDDNARYQEYTEYLAQYQGRMLPVDVSQRLFVRVLDGAQMPVAGAVVQLFEGDRQVFEGQTVSDGRVMFLPRAAGLLQAGDLRAVVSRGQAKVEAVVKAGGPEQVLTLAGLADNSGAVSMDIVFLLDATGSMSDEIERIKETIAGIAQRIEQLPGSSAPRFGLVAFRDRGDDYVTRQWDFTADVAQFSANLSNVYAGGGGDTPESVSAGLHDAIHLQGWAGNSAGRHLRMIILVGDAPPHVDYPNDYSYPALLGEAVARGIKIFPVGASNLDYDGEYVFRQFAQVTQGHFVFLTYANGVSGAPGVNTDKHVDNFTVQNLDSLIVGLVAGEVANQTGQKAATLNNTAQPVQVDAQVAPAFGLDALLDSLGDIFDGSNLGFWSVVGATVLVVLFVTRRPARDDPRPEAGGAMTLLPGVVKEIGPEEEGADERALVAAHIQPGAATIALNVAVLPARARSADGSGRWAADDQ